ncbi:COG3904 family protein [Roseicyclus marinus]|uniref:COG3904 family protein n=1 Tax=Roseicyclus marinus TaxID=2161673 RepID=UPI00240FBE66|nr:hypothetical protein [Roseicyclus marinus]MDG3039850.1 hypothetical protein [Roseicyclus marinus]
MNRQSQSITALFCLSLLVLAPQSRPASALQIQSSFDPRCDLVLSGEISQGDAERVRLALSAIDGRPVVCMNSPGGAFMGGLELSRLFMSEGIGTYIRAADQCYSSCALAFLGGSVWGDFRYASRELEPGGSLGFHAPYLTLPEGSYTQEHVAEAARTSVVIMRTLLSERLALNISDKFIIDFFLDERPQTRHIETVGELAHAGVYLAAYSFTDNPDVHDFQNACEIAFDVYRTYFSDPVASYYPLFELEESDFSRLLPVETMELQGTDWHVVSMTHDWGMPWQNASCAFTGERDYTGRFPAIIWNNEIGDQPSFQTAVRVLRLNIPEWYFLGKDTRLIELRSSQTATTPD